MLTAELPLMSVVTYADHKTPKPLDAEFLAWDEIVRLFLMHEFTDCAPCPGGKKCQKKRSQAFSPVTLHVPYRLDENVASVSMLVYDEDHITRAELEAVCDRLDGLESLISSTHSHQHGGPDDCCVRLILPLPRALNPEEFHHVYHEVRRRYGLDWFRPGATKPSGADPTTQNLSRLYFLPTAPKGSEVLEGHSPGALLDVEDLLRSRSQEAPRPPQLHIVPSPPPAPVDMKELRKALRNYNPQHKEKDEGKVISRAELVRRVEASEPLVKPEETGLREDSCHRIGKILANCLPEGTSKDAMLELVRPSIMALPVYADDGEDDTLDERFAKVAYSWDRGLVGREQRTEAKEARDAESDKMREGFLKRFGVREPKNPGAKPEADETAASEDEEAAAFEKKCVGWDDLLKWNPRKKNKDGSIMLDENGEVPPKTLANTSKNAFVLIAFSPPWRRVLRYNEVTKDVIMVGGPLAEFERSEEQIIVGVKYWLEDAGVFIKKNEVMDAIKHAARMNTFDPVKDYLLKKIKWADKKCRIDTFLETYCGVLAEDTSGRDISALIRRMSRCWLIGVVARGLDPGCKMDTVLIFEGEQGVKKSTMLGILGGEWFNDNPIAIGDKDSKMQVGRTWLAELAELSAVHASSVEAQKAFFSLRTDTFRPPYGYGVADFPRRCAFAGSTNDDKYMNDITGNRRFWPVVCEWFLIDRLREDRDLIWAEAVEAYMAGFTCADCAARKDGEDRCHAHRWWFTQAENKELELVNNERLKNEYAEAISDYILKMDPPPVAAISKEEKAKLNIRPHAFSMYEIATVILGLAPDRVNAQQVPIGRSLKALGFKKVRPEVDKVRQAVQHVVPQDLMIAPRRVRGRHLHSVPKPAPSAPDARHPTVPPKEA